MCNSLRVSIPGPALRGLRAGDSRALDDDIGRKVACPHAFCYVFSGHHLSIGWHALKIRLNIHHIISLSGTKLIGCSMDFHAHTVYRFHPPELLSL